MPLNAFSRPLRGQGLKATGVTGAADQGGHGVYLEQCLLAGVHSEEPSAAHETLIIEDSWGSGAWWFVFATIAFFAVWACECCLPWLPVIL
eukprot:jgi/Chrzof1/9805/Cz04g16090.t1